MWTWILVISGVLVAGYVLANLLTWLEEDDNEADEHENNCK